MPIPAIDAQKTRGEFFEFGIECWRLGVQSRYVEQNFRGFLAVGECDATLTLAPLCPGMADTCMGVGFELEKPGQGQLGSRHRE